MKKTTFISRRNPVGEILSFVLAFLFGALMQVLLKAVWKRAWEHEAPLNPSQPGVNWTEALVWGLLTGAAAGAVKVSSRRAADILQARLK